MLLARVEEASRRIGGTPARSAKVEHLAQALREAAPEEAAAVVAFLSGHPRQRRVGVGGTALSGAMRGMHAETSTLTVLDVDDSLERIAATAGPGSAATRAGLLGSLFARATAAEADFLSRLLVGELRQGALAGLMEEAVAKATGIPIADVRRAMMTSGDPEGVATAALSRGREALDAFRVQLFRPLQPMLAQPAEDVGEALGRLGEAALEYKLDGARIQVHKSGADIRVYSRLLNDVTAAAPEVVEAVSALPARELILDGEVIALKPDGTPHPFQTTMRRFGRKLRVEELRPRLPLTPFFFDLLRLDGQDLLDAPARERIGALASAAPGLDVPRIVTASEEEAEGFLAEALRRGHEGVVAKSLGASYEAGRRGFHWLKLKPAHTLDLVVLAAEWGHGRRQGFLSNLHLGARDPSSGGFVMLGKTFKGMTDEMLAWQTAKFQELAAGTDGWTVKLRPELVVEVALSDIQESPRYPAGLALRLARVKRYRPDKNPADADTIETVRAIHEGRVARGKREKS